MVAAARCLEPEGDPRPGRHCEIGAGLGVRQDLLERRGVRRPLEPEPQLLLGDTQLAEIRRVEIGARLEVLRGHPELRGQHAQRLHRRSARARLDP